MADKINSAMGKLVISASSAVVEEKPRPKVTITATDNVCADFVFESPRAPAVKDNSAVSSEVHVEKIFRRPSTKRKMRRKTIKPGERLFKLEQFNWLKTVGTGTFGRVVLCEDSTAEKENKQPKYFAMKILRISDVLRLKQVEHIQDEKGILEQLDHPFIVKLFWTRHDNANLYMLLEYAPGGELFTYLRSVRRFSSGSAMFYAAEIILALEYLHDRYIVYRDLKPENLLLDAEGHIKVTDFGFAKEIADRTWTLCGTPEYLAPEIIQSRGYNKAVDYWAFGILCFEMLVGHPPFYSDNPIEVYQKILDGKVRWPKQMDLVAKDLIKKLLTADRTKRLGNMKNGVEDIKSHRWFRPINWTNCIERKIEPPYVPQVGHPGDARNFDDYPEDWSDCDSSVTPEQLAIFQDF